MHISLWMRHVSLVRAVARSIKWNWTYGSHAYIYIYLYIHWLYQVYILHIVICLTIYIYTHICVYDMFISLFILLYGVKKNYILCCFAWISSPGYLGKRFWHLKKGSEMALRKESQEAELGRGGMDLRSYTGDTLR